MFQNETQDLRRDGLEQANGGDSAQVWMADVSEATRRTMAANKDKNTAPELLLRWLPLHRVD